MGCAFGGLSLEVGAVLVTVEVLVVGANVVVFLTLAVPDTFKLDAGGAIAELDGAGLTILDGFFGILVDAEKILEHVGILAELGSTAPIFLSNMLSANLRPVLIKNILSI